MHASLFIAEPAVQYQYWYWIYRVCVYRKMYFERKRHLAKCFSFSEGRAAKAPADFSPSPDQLGCSASLNLLSCEKLPKWLNLCWHWKLRTNDWFNCNFIIIGVVQVLNDKWYIAPVMSSHKYVFDLPFCFVNSLDLLCQCLWYLSRSSAFIILGGEHKYHLS